VVEYQKNAADKAERILFRSPMITDNDFDSNIIDGKESFEQDRIRFIRIHRATGEELHLYIRCIDPYVNR
jgi:hypothetical protein